MSFNDNNIDLPKIVVIKLQDKIKVRRLMNRKSLLFHLMLKQGITWLLWQQKPRKLSRYQSSTDLFSAFYTFSDGLYTSSQMYLLAQIFSMPTTGGNCRCGGENYIDAGDPYI